MKPLYLSPSKIATYERCPRLFWYQKERIEPEVETHAFPFGDVLAKVQEAWLRGYYDNKPINPVAVFDVLWDRAVKAKPMRLSTKYTVDGLRDTGRVLSRDFPQVWKSTGLKIRRDAKGKLMIEYPVSVDIGHGVIVSGRIDFVVEDQHGRVGPVDGKAPGQLSPEGFATYADQLLFYQIALEAEAKRSRLGFDRVGVMAFIEGVKNKVPKTNRGRGPYWHFDGLSPRRSDNDVAEYLQKVHWIAEDIRKGRFPKRTLMAYNSPCKTCDLIDACLRNDMTGLRIRKPHDLLAA